ncbi:unnamed protein product [Mytilus coruscus]|uniref:Uncharacterized protein n=1 Tax=Mytilus coruscus TaxID=42192 RepID=A0A6J8DP84_MYTCO|nr:unnamed protein product [Mytilus coruscus]
MIRERVQYNRLGVNVGATKPSYPLLPTYIGRKTLEKIPTNTPEVPSPVPTVGCGIPPECPGFNEDAQCVMDMPPTPIEIFCQFFLDNLEVTTGNKRGVQVRGQHVLKDLMTRHRKNWGKKGKKEKKWHYWKPKFESESESNSFFENVCSCPEFDVLITACEEIIDDGPIIL